MIFWGCVTSKGVWALVQTSETTVTQKYIEILEKYLMPSVSRYFGDHAITIQHNTTPCHASRLIRKYLEENYIFMMEWPAYSHDLNIIVNIWLSVKRKIQLDAGEINSKEDIID